MAHRMTVQRNLAAAGCGLAVAVSLGGLLAATGPATIEASVTRGLPSVAAAWRVPAERASAAHASKLSPVVLRSAARAPAGPVAGDEGYWLNAALAGGDGAMLAVGERMTIADRTYVVSELRPLVTDEAKAEAKAAHNLTLVVAREMRTDGSPSRTLRFLIEGGQVTPPAEPGATTPAPAHRTL